MNIPRTVQDILDRAEELAKRFEDYEPSPTDERDPEVFGELRRAVLSRPDAERSISDRLGKAQARDRHARRIATCVLQDGPKPHWQVRLWSDQTAVYGCSPGMRPEVSATSGTLVADVSASPASIRCLATSSWP